MLSDVDRFIVTSKLPWKLAKNPDAVQQLDDALYASAETLRIAVALLHPRSCPNRRPISGRNSA